MLCLLAISTHKHNLKPTLANYIYHKNERGKSPKQSVAKAIELDDTNGYSYAVLGFLFMLIKQYDQAIAEAERGITLNPNVAESMHGGL
jgi:tetratricopeptide (TPR) repeat protein